MPESESTSNLNNRSAESVPAGAPRRLAERWRGRVLGAADLQVARLAARERYRQVARLICAEAGVVTIEHFERRGRAVSYPKKGMVKIEDPTTRWRVLVAAHEAGHVALRHGRRQPRYVEEFEAWQYAITAVRRHGLAVPRRALTDAKRGVAWTLEAGLRRGLRATKVDYRVLQWCGPVLGERHTSIQDVLRARQAAARQRRMAAGGVVGEVAWRVGRRSGERRS